MFEKVDSTKYLINILKHNYQSKSCNHNIYILIVIRFFKTNSSNIPFGSMYYDNVKGTQMQI